VGGARGRGRKRKKTKGGERDKKKNQKSFSLVSAKKTFSLVFREIHPQEKLIPPPQP
jgi:hypothetical protein